MWDCPHSFCDEIENLEKWVTKDSAVSCSEVDIVCILREQGGREGGGQQQRAAGEYGMQVLGFCSLFQGKTFHFFEEGRWTDLKQENVTRNSSRKRETGDFF